MPGGPRQITHFRPVVPDGPRVLIVGAGIVGLALAASLERFGITPVVAEIGDASLLEGPVTPELLEQHPPVFSASLKAFDEVVEDPFAPVQGTT